MPPLLTPCCVCTIVRWTIGSKNGHSATSHHDFTEQTVVTGKGQCACLLAHDTSSTTSYNDYNCLPGCFHPPQLLPGFNNLKTNQPVGEKRILCISDSCVHLVDRHFQQEECHLW